MLYVIGICLRQTTLSVFYDMIRLYCRIAQLCFGIQSCQSESESFVAWVRVLLRLSHLSHLSPLSPLATLCLHTHLTRFKFEAMTEIDNAHRKVYTPPIQYINWEKGIPDCAVDKTCQDDDDDNDNGQDEDDSSDAKGHEKDIHSKVKHSINQLLSQSCAPEVSGYRTETIMNG